LKKNKVADVLFRGEEDKRELKAISFWQLNEDERLEEEM